MKVKVHYTLFIFFIISFFCNFFIETLIMFCVLLCHELGHLYFLKKYKREITSITFYPFGGIIKHANSCNSSLKEDFLIQIGGLLVNIILLFVFHTLNLQTCLLINYGIILFNIVPIYPLDGSKIIKTLINYIFCYKVSMYLSEFISFMTIIIVLILNVVYIQSYYIIFLLIALLNINIRYLYDIKKEYQIFLTNKYIYPNEQLKTKHVYLFKNPLNKLYLGRNVVFIIDNIKVNEKELLKKHFSYT